MPLCNKESLVATEESSFVPVVSWSPFQSNEEYREEQRFPFSPWYKSWHYVPVAHFHDFIAVNFSFSQLYYVMVNSLIDSETDFGCRNLFQSFV